MFKIDPDTDDLDYQNGSLQVLPVGSEERGQMIRERLLTVQGEWFLNTSFGINYSGLVWKKQAPPQVRDAHIQRQILLSAGAGSKIKDGSYEATLDGPTRTFTVTADVILASGETITVIL